MFWLALAALAFLGAVVRYILTLQWNQAGWPLGTLVANVSGATVVGALWFSPWLQALSPVAKTALVTGFLGALTTFSTYSLELVLLLDRGLWLRAGLYFLLSNGLALCGCWLGVRLGRHFLS